jgi:hypothetical protein
MTAANSTAIVTASHDHGVQCILSIGGSDDQNWDAACNATNRATFVQNIIKIVTQYGYDGVDLDVEQDFGYPNHADYVATCAALKAALDALPGHHILTAASDPSWQYLMTSQAAQYFDQINLMSYNDTVANAATDFANYTNLGVPVSKLAMGIGMDPGMTDANNPKDAAAKAAFVVNNGGGGVMEWLMTDQAPTYQDMYAIQPYLTSTPAPPKAPVFVSFTPDTNGVDTTSTINLAGTAEAGSTVTVFDGTTNLGPAAVDSNGNWTFTENNAVNGTHVFTATDTDANGTSLVSSQFDVTVNVPPPPNLVTDGGFEQGFTGWVEKGHTGDFSITTSAHSGDQAAALHDNHTGRDSLSQTLNTVVGQTYTLDFWLANTAAGTNSFIAKVGGQTLYTETHAGQEGYTEHTVQFTATSSSTTLQFQFHNSASWHLDDVSVVGIAPLSTHS